MGTDASRFHHNKLQVIMFEIGKGTSQLLRALGARLPCPALLLSSFILACFFLALIIFFTTALALSLSLGASSRALECDYLPLLGSAIPFFRRRSSLLASKKDASYFVGCKHIINVSSLDGRRTFFENKNLSLPCGAGELLAGLGSGSGNEDDHAQDFIKSLLTLLRPSLLAEKLPIIASDVQVFTDSLARAPPSGPCSGYRVLDPFEVVYPLIFKLIMRVIGVKEWLENQEVLDRNLSAFCNFEGNCSRVGIAFPWLVTPTYIKKLYYGSKLYLSITDVVKRRRKSGKQENDAVQFLLDENKDVTRASRYSYVFIFSTLSSGITTEGCSAAWLTVFLANSRKWQTRCRDEVDGVIAKNRISSVQSNHEILGKLSLQQWESEFPVIIASFRETVRLVMPGAMFRKNVSGSPVSIGGTNLVIPNRAFVSFLVDNVHMNPTLYPEPTTFNPERYLSINKGSETSEHKPHAYVGWGSGRHLCPGMRLAKLEITMVTTYLLAMFHIQPSDEDGCEFIGPFPAVDRNWYRIRKPDGPIYVRLQPRN
ncbi:cytochrome P450 [Xylaria cubensis]|nr:cytochrome P450 [Xylaria cubensis]